MTVAARSARGRSRSLASTTSSSSPPATQPSRSATQAGGTRIARVYWRTLTTTVRPRTVVHPHPGTRMCDGRRLLFDLGSFYFNTSLQWLVCSYRNQVRPGLHPAPAHRCHICAGTGPTPAASVPGRGRSPESVPPRPTTECLLPRGLALPRVRLSGRQQGHTSTLVAC